MPGDSVGVKGFARARARIAILALVSITGAGGFWLRTFHQPPAPIGVVIITLDTTRADRLSVYGFMDAAMPHLDRLARAGVVFDQATSVAPLTLPAHCSLFTGLFPPDSTRSSSRRIASSLESSVSTIVEEYAVFRCVQRFSNPFSTFCYLRSIRGRPIFQPHARTAAAGRSQNRLPAGSPESRELFSLRKVSDGELDTSTPCQRCSPGDGVPGSGV
jgi:hypothetical protein